MTIKKNYKIQLAKTLSGHFYGVTEIKKNGKEKFLGYYPSSTTILAGGYPQSEFLTRWIASNGWQESQRIKSEAGERGTRIHAACDLLEAGQELLEVNYATEEWVKIKSFVDWYQEYQPQQIVAEFPVFSKKGGYAGRLDRIYLLNSEHILVDFKSSSGIHDHFPLQLASYAKAVEENTDLKINQTAILQLGATNRNGYRFVLYPDWREHYQVFQNVKATWEYANEKIAKEPPVLDLPSTLKLTNDPVS